MKFGICLPIRTDHSIEFNIDLAKKAEQLGFDSVWVSDHVVIPKKIKGTFTSVFYDPFVLLSAISSATKSIKIGTSVIVVPYRNPVVVAKMLSTLDNLSKGRLIFGVASGWLQEEFDALDADFKNRGRITDEYLGAILNLWSEENPSFSGEFVEFSEIDFYPKPYNGRIPNIWVGGSSKFAIRRSLNYGSGWQPTWVSPEKMVTLIESLQNIANGMGRNLEDFTLSVRNRIKIGDHVDSREISAVPSYMFPNSWDEIEKDIDAYLKLGVEHILFDPATDKEEETFELINTISCKVLDHF
ncbi:MAG: TIGR03619 family F420-dependent LLM class oxidoreductase [Candidatus Dadabacteria bacterium]|nr:TIGR03619 family F420-dependent LLM class oxidoreductase [Candidatus Dadabacteria bacterium]NIT13355.1 TIGR03619 family F420-dependent LLM class oxidoreductase [Candidatus Dadabacteria bacterium]